MSDTTPTQTTGQSSPQRKQDSAAAGHVLVHINLPPEIRHYIVDSIEYEKPDYARVSPPLIIDLLCCCLVSKQWRDAAVPVLSKVFRSWDPEDFSEQELQKLVQRVSQIVTVSPDALMCCEEFLLSVVVPLRTEHVLYNNSEDAVIDIVRMLPGLRSITIQLEEAHWMAVQPSIEHRKRVREFLARIQEASHGKIISLEASQTVRPDDELLSMFEPIFVEMSELREVKLEVLDDFEADDVMHVISKTSPHIEVLDLLLDTDNAIYLSHFVEAWRELKALRFRHRGSDPDHVTSDLLNSLGNHCHELEELVVPGRQVKEEDSDDDDEKEALRSSEDPALWESSLIRMIKSCTKLRKLDLTLRPINDASLAILVTQTPSLEHLVLRGCLALTGILLLATDTTSSIRINLPLLRFLDLRGCHELEPAAIQLLASLSPSLEVLKLPSSLEQHSGLAAYFEYTLGLVQDKDEEAYILTQRWVKPHVAEERKRLAEEAEREKNRRVLDDWGRQFVGLMAAVEQSETNGWHLFD